MERNRFHYSSKSKERLVTLHPDLQVIFSTVLETRDHSILEGHRSDARQNELFEQGKTKVRAGKSQHNFVPSMAVDVAPWPFAEKDWLDRDKWHLFAGYVLGIADRLYEEGKVIYRLRWGGDWDKDCEASDNEFDDFPHFELIWRQR